MRQILPAPLPLYIHDMAARPGRIRAYREGRERQRRRLARRGDERAVDEDLQVVVACVERDGLVEEVFVFAVGVPADYDGKG